MEKLKIAVIFGGCSPEHGVSLQSAHSVLSSMDKSRFEPVMVGVSKEGDWFLFDGPVDKIPGGRWLEDSEPLLLDHSRGRRGLYLPESGRRIGIDAVFPVMHGSGGEDGTVQGLCELAGLPLVGCGVLASALCMDKDRAHKLAAGEGIAVPPSFTVGRRYREAELLTDGAVLGYPVFVKPLRAGSSYGISRVTSGGELTGAVELALKYDSEVIIEKEIKGCEVGCAVMGTDRLITGEPDEIEISGGFFDFEEKYSLKTSKIHVPARVGPKIREEIKETAKRLYRALGCRGFARVDMFLTKDGLVFNEINTIPGFTSHSRFPMMMKAAGFSFEEIITMLIEEAVK